MLHCQPHAALHRTKGRADDVRDFRLRESAKVRKFDHRALFRIEIVECTPDVAFELMLHGYLGGSAAISCPLASCIEFDHRTRPTLTIDCRIAQYGQKPRPNAAADDTARARPKSEKGLLCEVVCRRTIRADARCERENRRAMAAVQFLERIGATRDDETQERPIIKCVYLLERSPHATYVGMSDVDLCTLTAKPPATRSFIGMATIEVETPSTSTTSGYLGLGLSFAHEPS